jgi:hypothetical protein
MSSLQDVEEGKTVSISGISSDVVLGETWRMNQIHLKATGPFGLAVLTSSMYIRRCRDEEDGTSMYAEISPDASAKAGAVVGKYGTQDQSGKRPSQTRAPVRITDASLFRRV